MVEPLIVFSFPLPVLKVVFGSAFPMLTGLVNIFPRPPPDIPPPTSFFWEKTCYRFLGDLFYSLSSLCLI